MRISKLSIPLWAIAPVVLTIETAVCSVTAAALLDTLVRRPQVGGGSITTLLPGFVYACATVMKVCTVGALVSAAVGLAWRLSVKAQSKGPSQAVPVWAVASVAITPSTPLVGTIAVLIAQESSALFPQMARWGVFVMLAMVLAGVLAAGASLNRRERPRILSMTGLAANMVLIALFWHFRFYAPGFDQDLWAPR